MERDQGGLDGEPAEQQHEADHQAEPLLVEQCGQGRGVAELDGTAGESVQPCDPHQQHGAAGQGVGQVGTTSRAGTVGALVDHQGIGGDREQLVEDEERHEVAGERDPHRGRHTEAEVAKEACAVVVAGEVAHRVDRGRQPQQRGEHHEQQRDRVHPHHQVDPG